MTTYLKTLMSLLSKDFRITKHVYVAGLLGLQLSVKILMLESDYGACPYFPLGVGRAFLASSL